MITIIVFFVQYYLDVCCCLNVCKSLFGIICMFCILYLLLFVWLFFCCWHLINGFLLCVYLVLVAFFFVIIFECLYGFYGCGFRLALFFCCCIVYTSWFFGVVIVCPLIFCNGNVIGRIFVVGCCFGRVFYCVSMLACFVFGRCFFGHSPYFLIICVCVFVCVGCYSCVGGFFRGCIYYVGCSLFKMYLLLLLFVFLPCFVFFIV